MSKPLNVLLVEDSEDDGILTRRQLTQAGFELHCERIDSAEQMQAALRARTWDVVISDYHLPGFSGAKALELLRQSGQDIPFIIVSGAIGEETAVELMRAGAHDYIMKDNLARLAPAVERELREAGERRARREAEADLRLAAKVFEGSVEGILITDPEGCILRVNRAFLNITGYRKEEIIGQKPRMLQSGRHDEAFYRHMWTSLIETGSWQGEIWNRRKSGEIYPEWLTISAVHDEDGQVTHYIGGFTDLSQQKQAEDHIQHLMYYDALTGLPNRALFRDRFRQCMLRTQRSNDHTAFVHLDLDRFIKVNDTLGHSVGDQMLQQVAKRLSDTVRPMDMVARLGGDEFALAVPAVMSRGEVEGYLQNVIEAFAEPFRVADREIFLVPSMGVVMYPDDAASYDELARFAETALQYAKRTGESFQFYHCTMNADAHERLNMESALRRALERDEFRLHYQPQVDVGTGDIIGVEALLRWERNGEGMVLPGQFIPLLEDTGLIIPVGEWVMRRACQDQKAWQEAGLAAIPVAVNLSPRQFRNRDLVHMIGKVLDETGTEPQLLELEITESSVMDDPEFALQTLHACHDRGIRIAIDDFGTGYSSLSYLKRFPLDVLKIDRSFVADVPGNEDDVAIIDTIIAMAHRLNLRVIAEGVETAEQQEFLREHGCDWVQGYYFGRPMPLAEFLQRQHRRAG